jgi:hypothetical protein
MNDLIARIERLVTELAQQQLARDDWWKPELASIKEALADREYERRVKGERRQEHRAS